MRACQLSADLRALVAQPDPSPDDRPLHRVAVSCRGGAEVRVAEQIRQHGGTVHAIVEVFDLLTADLGVADIRALALDPAVREIVTVPGSGAPA